MADNEADVFGGGALTQDALDALLAAASAEGGETAVDEKWAQDSITEDIVSEPAAFPTTNVVDLPSFDSPTARTFGGADSGGMTRVRDIPLEITVELGRTRLLIRDILDLGTGSIIELDKLAGEPVDLFANGLIVARGEVIVIDDNFGVRVTEIITAADRSQKKEAAALAA
jgi:flagellar motor switch protein FliN/FliY